MPDRLQVSDYDLTIYHQMKAPLHGYRNMRQLVAEVIMVVRLKITHLEMAFRSLKRDKKHYRLVVENAGSSSLAVTV